MARPKTKNKKISISLQLPPDVWAKFKEMVAMTGSSINYCLERVIRDVISVGEIPGLQALSKHQERENAKFSDEAVPVYDGEENAKEEKRVVKSS